ncbi:hypothetical protein ACFL0O_11335, partial [Thermodesulfobacteriota bacterium]
MSRLKIAGKTGIAIFLALMITLFGIVVSLKTAPAQRMILNRVNSTIPGAVDFESFRFSLLAGTFELLQPSLVSPSGEAIVGCKRLFGDIEWAALLQRTVAVTDLLLDSPWVNLHLDTSGKTNLTRA